MKVLVIHGRLDQVIPFHCGEVSFFKELKDLLI